MGSNFTNRFEDNAPLNGINYYRLAAVSTDGSVTYSNVIAIEEDAVSVKLFPNPVKNILHIEGLPLTTYRSQLTIHDFIANIKAQTTITGSSYNWNVSQLKPGNYLLRIETNGNVVSKKFVKE
jgi:hypothetical protein